MFLHSEMFNLSIIICLAIGGMLMGKRFKVLRFVLLFVLTAALAALVLWFIMNKEPVTYTAPVPSVRVEAPHDGQIVQSLKFNAYVEAESMIPVVPFVNGTIIEYFPEQGMEVTKDQVLVEIDKKPYQLQYDQAKAAYLAAQSSFDRISNLVSLKAASQQNLDEITAQRDAYKAQMDLAEVQIGYATVKAPVSGTILTTDSAKGSIAAQGNLLCAIADLSKMVVRVAIPEKYYTLINQNSDSIKATVFHGSDSISTTVNSLSPFINPQSKTFVLELKLDGDLDNFRPGMFVTVQIDYLTLENVPVMSLSVMNTDGTMYIYDRGSEKVQMVDFVPEAKDNENFMVPDKYFSAHFVVDGQGTVFDGQTVRVVE